MPLPLFSRLDKDQVHPRKIQKKRNRIANKEMTYRKRQNH